MLSPDRLAAGVEVIGQLEVMADGAPLRLEFRGQVIELILPDIRTSFSVLKSFERFNRKDLLRSLQAAICPAGLELEVWVGRRLVGRLRAGSRPGWLSSWLGLDPMELKAGALLAVLVRRDSSSAEGKGGEEAGVGDK